MAEYAAPSFDGIVYNATDGTQYAYMIPPAAANHASSIISQPLTQELLIAWFAGIEEGASDVSIMLSHLPPNSKQWTKAMNISHRSKYSNQNPVLFYDDAASPHGLHVVHSQQPGGSTDESTATVWPLRVLRCAALQHGGLRCNVSYCGAMWCTASPVECVASRSTAL